jgi:TolA-binding protein
MVETRLQTAISAADYAEGMAASSKSTSSKDGRPNDDTMRFLENRLKALSTEIKKLQQKMDEIDTELDRISKLQTLDVDSRV